MADKLRHEIIAHGFSLNVQDLSATEEEPSMLQVRELFAKSLAWDSWASLNKVLCQPHEAVYLDDHPDMLNDVALRMSQEIGYDYAHGMVYNILLSAGIGYSPAKRRELFEIATPWGPIQESNVIAEGITEVSTASHGGYVLSEERQNEMPAHLSNGTPYYEEDCEFALVQLAFPAYFKEDLKYALSSMVIGIYSSQSVPHKRIVGSKQEEFLSEVLMGYVPPESDPMNRDPTADELAVVDYLSQCVLYNKQPVAMPDNHAPSLQSSYQQD